MGQTRRSSNRKTHYLLSRYQSNYSPICVNAQRTVQGFRSYWAYSHTSEMMPTDVPITSSVTGQPTRA